MIKKRGFPRIFFGWWTVLAGGILPLWAAGYYHYGISALFKPISSELGFSRAAASVPTAIGRLEGGIEAPLSGWLTDRYGPRWIVIFGVFLTGLGLILMNYINSLWGFYIVWGIILGTAYNIGMSLPLETAVTNWFVKKRGVALSIRWVLSGLSGVLTLPLIAWFLTILDWRMACIIGGVVMWLIGLPLAWFCLKPHRPEYYGLLPDGATTEEKEGETDRIIEKGIRYATDVDEVEFTLRQAMRTPAYWLLIAAHAFHGLATSAFNIHSIPLLTDMGIAPLRAAGMMVICIAVGIPFRFVGGILADRLQRQNLRYLLGGAYFLQSLGIAVFLVNQTTPMVIVWFVLYGIGNGVAHVMFPALSARYFGRKAFGSIQGSRTMFMAPFSMVAPIYCGWVYDTTGSYITAFVVFAATLAISTVLMSLTQPPKPPTLITDIRRIV